MVYCSLCAVFRECPPVGCCTPTLPCHPSSWTGSETKITGPREARLSGSPEERCGQALLKVFAEQRFIRMPSLANQSTIFEPGPHSCLGAPADRSIGNAILRFVAVALVLQKHTAHRNTGAPSSALKRYTLGLQSRNHWTMHGALRTR